MKFTLDIPDDIVGGIAAARAERNATLGEDEKPYDTDKAYLTARVLNVVQSWADQYGVSSTKASAALSGFLDSVPVSKRKAVEAAITAELAK